VHRIGFGAENFWRLPGGADVDSNGLAAESAAVSDSCARGERGRLLT